MAEFAATRMDQRKIVEFRIFFSYMTPLILATYYAIKVNPEYVIDVSWWAIGFLLSMLIGIHFAYISWQICLSVAMRNDAQRRTFCLKKAECMLHHLSKSTNTPFLPGNNTNSIYFSLILRRSGRACETRHVLIGPMKSGFVPLPDLRNNETLLIRNGIIKLK